MRHPLIRQGEGPAAAHERIQLEHAAERAKIKTIIRDTTIDHAKPTRATAAGDKTKLRGIPVQARGVGGTAPGTDPLAHLLDTIRRSR